MRAVLVATLAVLLGMRSAASTRQLEPSTLIRTLEHGGWKFATVEAGLAPVYGIDDSETEINDWREYAYDGGALRVYVSRGGGDIIAVLADATNSPYGGFAQLAPSPRYGVYLHDRFAVVVPVRPIAAELFDVLKAKSWSTSELVKRLGRPSYSWHAHGVGFTYLEYVPQGLTFVDDLDDDERYVLCDRHSMSDRHEWESLDRPPSLRDMTYATYRGRIHAHAEDLAEAIVRYRTCMDEALSSGLPSPDGRFVVTSFNINGSYNNEEIVIKEQGKLERRYHAEYFGSSFAWLDDRTVLYRVQEPTGEVYFYTLDAVTGVKQQVRHLSERAVPRIGSVPFGVERDRRFWYETADGKRRTKTVPRVADLLQR